MHDRAELHKALARNLQQALQHALERQQRSSALRENHNQPGMVELEQLKLQLAETTAERDAARRARDVMATQSENMREEVEDLKSSLASATSRVEAIRQKKYRSGWWSRSIAAGLGVFAFATLFSTVALQDAQSNVQKSGQPEVSASNAVVSTQAVSEKDQSDSEEASPPPPDKKKTRFAKAKEPTQRQWGPSLFMSEPGTAKQHSIFNPLVKEQQQDLLTLGFEVGEADGFNGARTRQAIAEFRALYLPQSVQPPQGAALATIIRNYANLARGDAGRFGIDHGIVAAIRLSSVRTGVDFSYLMKLAAAESNFKPASQSVASSATGMYQFTRDTWLNALKMHGARYGLADYATEIEYYVTRSGYRRPLVSDKMVYEHLLDLRKNPRISAMMAAESVRDSWQTLAQVFDRDPTEADLYLTHFLGDDAAITFLRSLDQTPDTFAVELFPEAAGSNHDIFHPKTCDPRTVDEVYELFGEKFSTRRYDDLAAN